MLARPLIVFLVLGLALLCGCPRHASGPLVPVSLSRFEQSLSYCVISHPTDEERLLREYKKYYEQFALRNIGTGDLTLDEEAQLKRDYHDASWAFNYWLSYVADTVNQQEQLEPAGEKATEYSMRADAAVATIGKLNEDASKILRLQPPVWFAKRSNQPYSLGYKLVGRFACLGTEGSFSEASDLSTTYSWQKL